MKKHPLLDLEDITRNKVSHSLSKLEIAISEWDGAKKKPANLEPRMRFIRKTHLVLSEWLKASLSGENKPSEAKERLADFTRICLLLEQEKAIL
jgi:hypothetical protein